MRRHRKKKRRLQGEVTLNLAAMLDMAFQLLAFFILTFEPAPVEGQISLRMPPPIPIVDQKGKDIGKDNTTDVLAGMKRIVVSVYSSPKGDIRVTMIDVNGLPDQPTPEQELAQLEKRLAATFQGTAFDEVVLQVGSGLRYEQLMQVVGICTRLKLANGEKLSKLTFVELNDGSFSEAGKSAAKSKDAGKAKAKSK